MRRSLVMSVGLTLPQGAAAQGLAHAPIPVVQMLASAHVVVQGVSAILALALFATTTILLYKAVALPVAARRLRQSRALITSAATLAALGPALAARRDPAARMAEASRRTAM